VRRKSSPVSISDMPVEEGRLADAINPLGSPVLKKNGSALAGIAATTLLPKIIAGTKRWNFIIGLLLWIGAILYSRISSPKVGCKN
jgi:hypothetical protein